MKKTKLEDYLIANSLLCTIDIGLNEAHCCLYNEGDLYLKYHKGKTLNEAIQKAITTHRERFEDDKRSKQDIQNEKAARMLHKRFSDRKHR